MKKIYILIFFTLFISVNIKSESLFYGRYLLIDSPPLISSIGESLGVSIFSIESEKINPAGIAKIKNLKIFIMQNFWFENINNQRISVVKNFDSFNSGVNFSYFNLGQIEKIEKDINNTPIITGEIINLYSFVISFNIAKKIIKNFFIGIKPKVIYENIGKENFYFAVDGGIIIDKFINKNFSAGISLLNISNKEKYSLPLNLNCSISYKVSTLLIGSGLSYLFYENNIKTNIGIIYNIFKNLSLRGGIEITNEIKFTGGIGINFSSFSLSYSYEPYNNFNDVHKISLTANFYDIYNDNGFDKTFIQYKKSGDYYYNNKKYELAIKYYEYLNLLYWKDIEDKWSNKEKSKFYQKLGICYYNLKNKDRAREYFDRAYYYDKNNEILKYWIKFLSK